MRLQPTRIDTEKYWFSSKMADDEQFSLCWNNFNTNLSAGFHESLCRGDLVDVSLAAEGHIVKAHRLVLSVCSPFFRKMFTQMPSNTHAIGEFSQLSDWEAYSNYFFPFAVFLNNVSHSALKDLIQFMYCGEVNVKQDALPAFISTAESLQIKGLTDVSTYIKLRTTTNAKRIVFRAQYIHTHTNGQQACIRAWRLDCTEKFLANQMPNDSRVGKRWPYSPSKMFVCTHVCCVWCVCLALADMATVNWGGCFCLASNSAP